MKNWGWIGEKSRTWWRPKDPVEQKWWLCERLLETVRITGGRTRQAAEPLNLVHSMQGQRWEETALVWEWQNHGISFKDKPENRDMCSSSKKGWRTSRKSQRRRKSQTKNNYIKYRAQYWRLNNSWEELRDKKAFLIHQQRLHHAPRYLYKNK